MFGREVMVGQFDEEALQFRVVLTTSSKWKLRKICKSCGKRRGKWTRDILEVREKDRDEMRLRKEGHARQHIEETTA